MAAHPTLRIRIPIYKQEQLSPNLPTGLLCPRPSSYADTHLVFTPFTISPIDLDHHDSSSEEDSPTLYTFRMEEFLSGNKSLCPSLCTTV